MIVAIDFSNSNNFTGYPNIPDSLHGSQSPYAGCLKRLSASVEQLPISEMYCVRFGDEKTTDKRVASLIDGEPEQV